MFFSPIMIQSKWKFPNLKIVTHSSKNETKCDWSVSSRDNNRPQNDKMSAGKDLRHYFGASKPQDDKKSDDLDNNDKDLKPKVKKNRTFSHGWLEKYHWLRYEGGKMCCHVCISAKATNPFTEGCTNFQNSTLLRHQDSLSHITSTQTLNLRSNYQMACTNVKNRNFDLKLDTLNEYTVQLRTVYVMAKRDLAADVFPSLMECQTLNGVKCDYYKRPQIVAEFEECIEQVLSQKLTEKLNKSDYIGIMLDETCDITVHKKLAIYARYVVDGEAEVSFLGNEHITDGTAAGVETATVNFLTKKGICDENFNKIYGLGTDGAAVMMGRLNGLGAKLKQRNPHLVHVHCVAHRLNLAASQAGKNIQYCQKYHSTIHSLYRYFSDSSVRYDKLRELQAMLGLKVEQVTEPTSVRWLSVDGAVKKIYSSYDAIFMSLESDKTSGKADGLLKTIADVKFLLFTALLMDVLTMISVLSLIFQKDSINLSQIRKSVSTTIDTLKTMKTGSNTVNEVFNAIGNVPGQNEKNTYKGLNIIDNQPNRDSFSNLRDAYIDQLVSNLESRFPQDQLELLECFDTVLNPAKYPENMADLQQYGDEQLNKLLEHFDTETNRDRAKNHFLHFKHFTRTHRNVLRFANFVKCLINEHDAEYPDFVVLAKIAIIIPVSSAPCERGFSVQNALKSKVRNRLNPERLNRLMFIKLIGPDINQFDFMSAARLFAQGAQGRL